MKSKINGSTAVEWCNSWGRKMGIYGNTRHGLPKGYDDDLDAFRHAFANALIVAYNPVGFANLDKFIAYLLGMFNEIGNPEHPCSYEMDVYNNKVGRDIAPNNDKMREWSADGKDWNEEIAKIVAEAVKSGKTINDISDYRMSKSCRDKYRKKRVGKEGIEKDEEKEGAYIWRMQGDSKVRSRHALRDGKMYMWDNPPEGGHPGEDYGCRCVAEPLSENSGHANNYEKLFRK